MDWLILFGGFILGLFVLDILKMFFTHREKMAEIREYEKKNNRNIT